MSDDPTKDLLSSIDEAAEYLLKQASTPSNNIQQGVEPATLAEQVRAFQAVVAWADKRRELLPKEKTETKFERLAGKFGETPQRRRSRPKAQNGADPAVDDGDAEPASVLDS